MKIRKLKSKIYRASVTGADIDYEGSIMIDEELMELSNLHEYEKVLVVNLTNGNRYETYVIKGKKGSKEISVNGAGARYSCVSDRIIIMSFIDIVVNEKFSPAIIILDENNNVKNR